jgi:hypothetical protein
MVIKFTISLYALCFCFFFSLIGIKAQEEIKVRGNLRDILDGDMTPTLLDRTDFDFAITGGSVVRTFTILNEGNSPLVVNSIVGSGDFSVIGALTPASPIPAGASANFTVTFSPTLLGQRTGLIVINNSDSDESVYEFAVQGTGAITAISTWDPLLYSPSPCSWTSQDNNTSNSPFASWSLAVVAAEAAGINAVITLQPDAYLGSFNYDQANGNESCLGHQVSATLDLNAAQNGIQILGSTSGCMTFIDLSSGSATDQWGNFNNMNGLTIKNIFLRQWGGAINLNNCTNVLIEDCIFEDVNNSSANAVNISGCTNVTFRRCKFLANNNNGGRALNITNSGTSGNRILLEDCEFGCNTSGGSGAALLVGNSSFVQVNGGIFSGNNSSAGGRGGAVNVQPGANVVFSNVKFMGNKSPGTGSSIDGGGAIFVDGNSSTLQTTVLIDGCNFFQNTAAGSTRGGAIVCVGNSSAINKSLTTIQNSRFERNGADRGGALLALNSTVIINNNVFTGNQSAALTNAANSNGGAISFQNSPGSYTITNNTFSGNLGPNSNRAINDAVTGSAFTLTGNSNIVAASSADPAQTENLTINNTGGTAGSNITLTSLSTIAASFNCGTTGTYCSITLPTACLSNTQSDFICSPLAAASASISGQVWNDANGNGFQASTDLGISGAFVLLFDEIGYLIGRTSTDASGNYVFTGLTPGNYTVVFINPSIASFTLASPANASGSTESTDSDQAFTTNIGGELRGATSGNIALLAGVNATNVDLGLTNILLLPAELISFNGSCNDNGVILSWSTSSETNNKSFVVEKAAEDMEFVSIGSVLGAGTTASQTEYRFMDINDESGLAYYRLTQVDFDGLRSSSEIIAVINNCIDFEENRILLYPNPTRGDFSLQFTISEESAVSIEIYNTLGQRLRTSELGIMSAAAHRLNVATSDLESGTYIVKLNIGVSTKTLKLKKT